MTRLAGKVAIVTGGNSGIGKEAAIGIAREGAHVVIAARNPTKAAAAVTEIEARADARGRVEFIPIDLASFASVREFAAAFNAGHDRLDILLNNAGLVLRKRLMTVDGHESQFQINHLGHFLLTNLLYGPLVRSAPAWVVNVSSYAHTTARNGLDFDDLDWERRRYRSFSVYSATKLMNLLFTRELARRNDPAVLTANALHPGFVASNFAREGDLGLLGTLRDAARATVRHVAGEGRAHLYLPGHLRRCRRHHRPILHQGQGREAGRPGPRRRSRGPSVGDQREADRGLSARPHERTGWAHGLGDMSANDRSAARPHGTRPVAPMHRPGRGGGYLRPVRLRRWALIPLAIVAIAACTSSSKPSAPSSTTQPPPSSTGSSVPSTKDAYVTAANAICRSMNTRVTALGAPPSDPKQEAEFNDQTGLITADGLRQLRELHPPAGDAATVAAIYTKVDVVLRDGERVSAQLRTGDQAGVQAAQTQLESDLQAANDAALAYGLTICGS